jgi:hypothetical protein
MLFLTEKAFVLTSPIDPSFIEIEEGFPFISNLTIFFSPFLAHLLNLAWNGVQLMLSSLLRTAIMSMAPIGS